MEGDTSAVRPHGCAAPRRVKFKETETQRSFPAAGVGGGAEFPVCRSPRILWAGSGGTATSAAMDSGPLNRALTNSQFYAMALYHDLGGKGSFSTSGLCVCVGGLVGAMGAFLLIKGEDQSQRGHLKH